MSDAIWRIGSAESKSGARNFFAHGRSAPAEPVLAVLRKTLDGLVAIDIALRSVVRAWLGGLEPANVYDPTILCFGCSTLPWSNVCVV